MSEWKKCKLGDIAEIYNHKRIPLSSMERNIHKKIYPYYGASGIIDYVEDFIFDGEFVLVSEDGENLATRKTPIAYKAIGKFWANNHCHILKGKEKFHNDLIVYMFQSLDINPYITGAVQPKLNKQNLLNIEFLLPPLDEQERIANVLSSLDDKIDLLHRQNKTLENLAQTLFKQYFIIEAKPDWEEVKFEYYITPKKGRNITKKETNIGNIPVIAGGLEPAYFHNVSNTKSPVITISASGANAGFVKLHYQEVWSSDSSYIDSDITQYIFFTYCFLKYNQNNIYDKQEGSAQPHIYPSHLMDLAILKYPNDLIAKFENSVSDYFNKIGSNKLQIQTLTNLRDTLLPKLMRGELRINDN